MESDPPYLTVGTDVSAKYKGAFCEAKIRKVVRVVKCKVTFKSGLGSALLSDDQIKGSLRVGANVEARHPDKSAYIEAVINKIQDCSQYTVVFDDGDITTLRRSALCLKSGRHFNESETLDQLPLTHPEHFSNPVVGGRRNVRRRRDPMSGDTVEGDESSDEETTNPVKKAKRVLSQDETDVDVGKVVCVEVTDKKKGKDSWFPGVIVSPSAQETVKIRTRDEYLVRSFRDGRYYTVPKKEITSFSKDSHGQKNDSNTNILRAAIEKAVQFIDKNELPAHWDKDILFSSIDEPNEEVEENFGGDSEPEESEEEVQAEEKDRFVAQLYKYMDDRGTPINKVSVVCNRDLDLYKLYKIVIGRGGYNKVTNSSQWKSVTVKMGFGSMPSTSTINLVKQGYKKFIHNFEEFNRKLGCGFLPSSSSSSRSNRSIIRDRHASSSSKDSKKEESKAIVTKEESPILEAGEAATVSDPSPESFPDTESEKIEEAEEASSRRARCRLQRNKDDETTEKSEKVSPTKKRRTTNKEKQEEIDQAPGSSESPLPPVTLSSLPAKRVSARARNKRKVEKEEKAEPQITPEEFVSDRVFIGKDVHVHVGDKLSVYFGKASEGKKYEAKVVDVNEEQELFFVHYAGWNIRYDEWIPRFRVAENLSLRTEPTASVSQGRGPSHSSTLDGEPSHSDSGVCKGTLRKGIRKRSKTTLISSLHSTKSTCASTPRKRLSSEGDAIPAQRKTRNRGTLSGAESGEDSSESEDKVKSSKRVRKPNKIFDSDGGPPEQFSNATQLNLSKSIPSPDISDFSRETKERRLEQVERAASPVSALKTPEAITSVSILCAPLEPAANEGKSDVYDFNDESTVIPPAKLWTQEKIEETSGSTLAKKMDDEQQHEVETVITAKQCEPINPIMTDTVLTSENTSSHIEDSTVGAGNDAELKPNLILIKDNEHESPKNEETESRIVSLVPVTTENKATNDAALEVDEKPVSVVTPTLPALVRGTAPVSIIPRFPIPIRSATPITICHPQRAQRPILIKGPAPVPCLNVPVSSLSSAQIPIMPFEKTDVAGAVSAVKIPVSGPQKSFQEPSLPFPTPELSATSNTTNAGPTARACGQLQSKIHVRPSIIEGPKLVSYPTARIRAAPGVLPIRHSVTGSPTKTLLGLKKHRKVKTQKFVESSDSSDGESELKQEKRIVYTPKLQTKQYSSPSPSVSLPVIKPALASSISSTSPSMSSQNKASLAGAQVTPIMKVKLITEKMQALTGGKIVSGKYTRVEQPSKLRTTIEVGPHQQSVIVRKSQAHSIVAPKTVLLPSNELAKMSILSAPAQYSTAPVTTPSTVVTSEGSKREEFLSFQNSLKPETEATASICKSAVTKTQSAVTVVEKEENQSHAPIPTEEDSCHSLLCEEEIPGSPTPGSESRPFAYEEKISRTLPGTDEGSIVNPNLFSTNDSKPLETNQVDTPVAVLEKLPVMDDASTFKAIATNAPHSLFTDEKIEQGSPIMLDEEMLLPKYPSDLEDNQIESPRPVSSSSTMSSVGSPRGDDEERHSVSGENEKLQERSDTDESIDCLLKRKELVDENSSSDDDGRKFRDYFYDKSSTRRVRLSLSPSCSPKKRQVGRRGSPDDSLYRGGYRSSIYRRGAGLDSEYGVLPPHAPVNLGKPPCSDRFNFLPELTDSMSQDERVEIVQASMTALKEKYKELKAELSVYDRKKKRIRKRERDRERRDKEVLRPASIA